MKPKVYIETSVISYYTARPSRDLIQAARQLVTYELWPRMIHEFDCFISDIVINEIVKGNENASQSRVDACRNLRVLQSNEEATGLSRKLVESGLIPTNFYDDALHMAIASIHGMEYLVTWNFHHLANAIIKKKLETYIFENEYQPPRICTIEGLMGGLDERLNY